MLEFSHYPTDEITTTCYNTDCMGKYGIPNVQEESIDLIILDLPFGKTQNTWDRLPDLDQLFNLLLLKLKSTGVIATFSTQPLTTDFIHKFRDYFRFDLIWAKEKGTNFYLSKNRPIPSHEHIVIFSKTPDFYYEVQMRQDRSITSYIKARSAKKNSSNYNQDCKDLITTKANNERYPLSVLNYARDHANIGIHPTQKPKDLISFLTRSFCPVKGIVLDPYGGSFTTGIVCLQDNRNGLLMEISPEYYQSGCKRMEYYLIHKKDEFWKIQKETIEKSQTLGIYLEGTQ